MSLFKNKIVQLILFLGFGFLLLYLVYRGQEQDFVSNCRELHGANADCDFLTKLFMDFKGAKLSYIAISLLLFFISNIFRAFRWQMQFKPMGYKTSFLNAFFSITLGYFVNLGFPRAGEVARIAAMSRNEDIPIEKVAGSLVVDRGMDVLCLLIIIALAISLEYEQMWGFLQANAQINPLLFLLPILPIAGLLWFLKIRKTSSLGIVKKINNLLIGFSDGILSVFKMKNKLAFLALTVGIWFCYYMMTYIIFFSYAPTEHLAPSSGLVVFSFGALGMVIPSPGGSGSYHYLIMKGLELFGVTSFEGFTLANLIFIPIQLLCNIGFGLMALIILPMLKKKKSSKST